MPRGQKICENCQTANGPRAYSCKNCNSKFAFKAKSKEQKRTKVVQNIDWKELQKGDRIKVSGGPYYVAGSDFIPMGYRGKFIVDSVDSNGIRAFGSDKPSGFCHIYMGRDTQNKDTKIWKTKHRIAKLKQRDV